MNYWLVIKDIVTIRSNSRRFFLAVTLFIFHKFTGTDSLNYFAPEIFEMIGVKGGSLPLLTTGVYGLVKFATTVIYVTVLVDRIGRRRPLLVRTMARTLVPLRATMLTAVLLDRCYPPGHGHALHRHLRQIRRPRSQRWHARRWYCRYYLVCTYLALPLCSP